MPEESRLVSLYRRNLAIPSAVIRGCYRGPSSKSRLLTTNVKGQRSFVLCHDTRALTVLCHATFHLPTTVSPVTGASAVMSQACHVPRLIILSQLADVGRLRAIKCGSRHSDICPLSFALIILGRPTGRPFFHA